VDFAFVPPGTPLPGDADLVILPGTKATLADLAFLRAQGWDIDLRPTSGAAGGCWASAAATRCWGAGFPILEGIEGAPDSVEGLGLLNGRNGHDRR
jgi:adenosylcobyric acid synthase